MVTQNPVQRSRCALVGEYGAVSHPPQNRFASGSLGTIYASTALLIISVMGMNGLLFVLSVTSDALHCEGRIGFMAAVSLLVSTADIGLTDVMVAAFDMGVAGAAAAWDDPFLGWHPGQQSFVRPVLRSAAIMVMPQVVGSPNYEATVSAYGITTLAMVLSYLPLPKAFCV